jgi:hypothetical protein
VQSQFLEAQLSSNHRGEIFTCYPFDDVAQQNVAGIAYFSQSIVQGHMPRFRPTETCLALLNG